MRGALIKSKGTAAQPCSPDVSLSADGTPTWQFPVGSMMILHVLQWDDWKVAHGRAALSTVKEPYVDSSRHAIFIIDGTESEGVALPDAPAGHVLERSAAADDRANDRTANDRTVNCPLCTQPWKAKLMPQHMGAHLLEESWAQYGKEKPRMPCMLCGVNSAVGQHMADPALATGCPISLADGSKKGVKKPVHQCALVGMIHYSLTSAATSSLETPCTNRPVQCKNCDLVIASYSMAQHYSDKHSTTSMPPELAELVTLGKHERAHTLQLLKKRKVTSVCGGAACCSKAPKQAKRG